MKNIFKTGVAALIIAISFAACKGANSNHPGDTSKTDSSVIDTSATGKAPGANGSPNSIDTGIDHSGSGGTDTTKKPL